MKGLSPPKCSSLVKPLHLMNVTMLVSHPNTTANKKEACGAQQRVLQEI